MFSTRVLPLIFLTCGCICGQSTPVFIAADVHKFAQSGPRALIGLFPESNHYELHGATMIDFITRAWGVNAGEIAGGPAWLGAERFELVAVVPNGANTDGIKRMLQGMLAERFGLAVHSETRPVSAFTIQVAKAGVKMKKSAGAQQQSCQSVQGERLPAGGSYTSFICKNTTVPQFAEWAQTQVAGYLAGTSLVDRTNLHDAWNFTLQFLQPNQLATAHVEGGSFFDAAEKQLGLKIASTKIPLPVIVVDKVDENPSATSPEVLKLLAGPTAFEVAVIRTSPPDSRPQGSKNIFPDGRIEFRYSTLQEIIRTAWRIFDDRIAGAPSFVSTHHFDISAKAPSQESAAGFSLASEETMLRKLLEDRFKLVAHNEDRMGDVLALVASKPKLKTADPDNRPGCRTAPPSNPVRNRMLVCQSVTMSQFVDELPNFAGGYFDGKPAVDSTGIVGSFDLTLNFSGFGIWQRANAAKAVGTGDTPPGFSDPISLQDAIQQQLGLKLEVQKRPVTVLVIDHINETPTEN
ncbi:MAG TPA: TIGR03435 family protein [Bryobacteraceae bacterium]